MSEDVIEFGSGGVPEREPRLRRRSWPPGGAALPLAASGAVATIASLLGPWQSTTVPYDGNESRKIGAALAALGSVGGAHVAIVVATIAAVVLTLFGQPPVRPTARLLGYATAGSSLAILGTMAYSLTQTSNLADFRLYPEQDLANVQFTLEWGLYAAFVGMLAFVAALVLSARPNPVAASESLAAAHYEEPVEMELEVSIYPASPKTSPGAGHELYMRP